jgi:hypothetical protein
MILYVNGDSHTHGMQLLPHERFSDIVAKEFNFDVVNAAQVGASNFSILRTTQEYLATGITPDLILIGWTTWEREEWTYENQFYNVNSSGHTGLPENLQQLYKSWVIDQTPETLNAKSRYWHSQIFKLHLELVQKNIKHVFFNCMYNFFQTNDYLDWGTTFIDPYNNDSSYYWWLTNQGIQSDQWYHFGADGHATWATKLINYIKEHDIIRQRR